MNESGFGYWVVKHKWAIVIATVLFVCLSGSGTLFLTFNNDIRVFFSRDNPQLIAMETQENTYSKNDNILFAVAPQDGNVFMRKTLAAIEELTETASSNIPWIRANPAESTILNI